MKRVVANTRVMSSVLTGVQRYARELLSRLGDVVDTVGPSTPAGGPAGHLWEQVVLPWRLRGRLLWSPGSTGPLTVRRQVVTIHDLAPVDHPEWFTPAFAKWYSTILPRLLPAAQRVITVSQFTKDRLVTRLGLDHQKIEVIHLGVGDQFVRPSQSEIDTVARRLGIGTSGYVLGLGSLEPRKNLTGLLSAWKHVSKDLVEDTSLVIGGAPGSGRVFRTETLSNVPDGVVFTGRVNEVDLPALYAGASGLVYPSLYEGFGLPPLEAMAVGTPVIASDIEAISEVVGSVALQVDPRSSSQLTRAIERILSDESLRKQLIARGLAHARRFTWEQTAQATRNLLLAEAAR